MGALGRGYRGYTLRNLGRKRRPRLKASLYDEIDETLA
jgi:hypothetical protein